MATGLTRGFNLGDRDLATHIRRTQLLSQGATLSEVTVELCRRLGISHEVVPMSDDPVRTVLSTDTGELAMQRYFVQHQAEPQVSQIKYKGAASARVSPGLVNALDCASRIVFCPSNPFLSLGPILAVPGVRERLENASALRLAVSPIIGGAALKGPAAKIMSELGHKVSCVGVAEQYLGLCDLFVIDNLDAHLSPAIDRLGIKPVVTSIIMDTDDTKVELAESVLAMGDS